MLGSRIFASSVRLFKYTWTRIFWHSNHTASSTWRICGKYWWTLIQFLNINCVLESNGWTWFSFIFRFGLIQTNHFSNISPKMTVKIVHFNLELRFVFVYHPIIIVIVIYLLNFCQSIKHFSFSWPIQVNYRKNVPVTNFTYKYAVIFI